ncbi:uncharacterized protein A1O5_02097 [Cladophialophora psammophila CBS 110553]|uniref:Zn(2)-C6 fungal-type domain-containing protein n=1 Tax=Cladophialophora psammophila CBS 110553 TaxID=1182543 RepID=W9XEP6_9EURO|nr:uncharacterized protein A1O5_02097 [Cladophialophora psammophila CBS 110553]EXJ75401.1 hypothetical protein A1O5_02097 [Cladophialophora psammophila CBS 110553]
MIRIGKNKVRTGCFTCKRRRVKCDEARPSCNRCIKAGKPCEGYANDPGSGRANEPVRFVVYSPHNPIPLLSEHPDLDWSERRALSYFQDRTALELAGAFQPDFWLATILPLARQETSVRHALIALSSMHEHFAGVDHFSPTGGVDFALNHYGKAMREVVKLKQSQLDRRFDYALVTCALFSALESIQGQYHEACNHAVSGIRILAEEQRSPSATTKQTGIPRETLTRVFIAMGRQIMEIGDPNFPTPRPELYRTKTAIPMPDQFTSHEHALLHMEFLLADLVEYAYRAETLVNQGPLSDDVALCLLTEFHAIKIQFGKWQAAFDAFSSVDANEYSRETPESSSSTASSPSGEHFRQPRSPAFLILRAYQALMIAFLVRIERNDEAAFNDFGPQFWTALDAVEEFIQCTSTFVNPVDSWYSSTGRPSDPTTSTSTSTSNLTPQSFSQPSHVGQSRTVRPTFSLALGIVPTLFLIASRTFDIALRDKALALLRMCNRREGLWDSRLAASLVDRVIELRDMARQMGGGHQHPVDGDVDDPVTQTTMSLGESQETNNSPPAAGGGSGGNGVEFKLLDIKFLPGRRCMFRYAFVTIQGKTEGTPIPMLSSEVPNHVPGAKVHSVTEFWEELHWEG